MEIPFLGAQRSQWKVKDRSKFFCALAPIFSNLSSRDRTEIEQRLIEEDPDYFELPIYNKKYDEEPVAIVIFEADCVYIDFIDPLKRTACMAKVQSYVGTNIEVTNWRDLTQKDWLTRLGVLELENRITTI